MSRHLLAPFLFSAALMVGSAFFPRTPEAKSPAASSALFVENTQNMVEPFDEDEILDAAAGYGALLVDAYRENASFKRHTVALVGEAHDMMPHHLFQAAMVAYVLGEEYSDNVIITVEDQPSLEKAKLSSLRAGAHFLDEEDAGALVRAYPFSAIGQGEAFRALTLAEALRVRTAVHFVDLPFDRDYPRYVDSTAAAMLQNGPFYADLKLPQKYTTWHTEKWERGIESETGRVLRDAHAAERIAEILDREDFPVLVIHMGGRDHLADGTFLGRPTLPGMLAGRKDAQVMTLPLLAQAYENNYEVARRHCPYVPAEHYALSFPRLPVATFFSLNKDDPSIRKWNDLCKKNEMPRYALDF